MNLFGELRGIEQMLNFHSERHGVLASNMANAETPGYRAKDLQFRGGPSAFARTLSTTSAGHIEMDGSHGGEVVELDQAPSVDGNGVDKDHTLAAVKGNAQRMEQGIDFARRRFALLRYSATDGGA